MNINLNLPEEKTYKKLLQIGEKDLAKEFKNTVSNKINMEQRRPRSGFTCKCCPRKYNSILDKIERFQKIANG